jgi:lysine 2,3-aminomutase
VCGVEDLRTPLSTILSLESHIRGTIAGFMMPNFMVTLPGGGGKRLACSYESYDRETGRSLFRAPNSHMRGGSDNEREFWDYWDPHWSLKDKDNGST